MATRMRTLSSVQAPEYHPDVAATPEEWIEIPAGVFSVGLTPDEAKQLAEVSARAARDRTAGSLGESLEVEQTSGNPAWVEQYLLDLYPAHDVRLEAYAISARRVTTAEYLEFAEATGAPEPRHYFFNTREEILPRAALGLSWIHADAYARWRGARLPTEAEWERAARGQERRLFPWGNEYGAAGALIEELNAFECWEPGGYPSLDTPDGIYDLVTPQWEWCADRFRPYEGTNPQRWKECHPFVEKSWRVRRGADTEPLVASAVTRLGGAPATLTRKDTTFRLVRIDAPRD